MRRDEKGQMFEKDDEKRTDYVPNIVKMTWPTPRQGKTTAEEMDSWQARKNAGKAAWATPKSAEAGPDLAKADRSKIGMALPAQVYGPVSSGLLALIPNFVDRLLCLSAWLMGYEWNYLMNWERRGRRGKKTGRIGAC